jgi:hypothetical protein
MEKIMQCYDIWSTCVHHGTFLQEFEVFFIAIVSGYCTAFEEMMNLHNGASNSELPTLCHSVQMIMSDCECTSKYFNSISCGNFRMTFSLQIISYLKGGGMHPVAL